MFTIFAPTNDALERLEKDRPWLFHHNDSSWAQERDAGADAGAGWGRKGCVGVKSAGGREVDGVVGTGVRGCKQGGYNGGGGEVMEWNPVREWLAYHMVPGPAQFSR